VTGYAKDRLTPPARTTARKTNEPTVDQVIVLRNVPVNLRVVAFPPTTPTVATAASGAPFAVVTRSVYVQAEPTRTEWPVAPSEARGPALDAACPAATETSTMVAAATSGVYARLLTRPA
jgi:hypothetical protein